MNLNFEGRYARFENRTVRDEDGFAPGPGGQGFVGADDPGGGYGGPPSDGGPGPAGGHPAPEGFSDDDEPVF